mgnify:CR=1 FL=1
MTTRDAKNRYLSGPRIQPEPIRAGMSADELVDRVFLAYNAGRIQTAARLLVEKGLEPEVTVGLSLAGAMSPAGITLSTVIPLVQAGFVDWIVSTGANLYHDAHFGLGLALHRGSHTLDDRQLFEKLILDYQRYVAIDPRYFRPTEVDFLQADPARAQKILGWEPRVFFKYLVRIMVDADLERIGLESPGEGAKILEKYHGSWHRWDSQVVSMG